NPEFESFQNGFYRNDSASFRSILDQMYNSGRDIFVDWMWPHSVKLVCQEVDTEFSKGEQAMHMSSLDVTADFLSTWDINDLFGNRQSLAEIMPVWVHILQAATRA
ncbi:hypothetical protein F5890DRAFT_1393209, partial [Lentinula detonsa]